MHREDKLKGEEEQGKAKKAEKEEGSGRDKREKSIELREG